MSNYKFLSAIILSVSVVFAGCKEDSYTPPTDEEILGNVVKPSTNDVYIYPIQPGSPEWAAFQNHDEMLHACEIPDSVLTTISTWGLLETCFTHPLAGDYMAFNSPSDYINNQFKYFNGLRELISRPDAPEVMLYEYRHMDMAKYPVFFDRHFRELIFGCDSFVSKLNSRQLIYLVSVAIEKAHVQKAMYTNTSFPPYSYFVMANAMVHAGYKPFIDFCATTQEEPVSEYIFYSMSLYPQGIEEYAKAFIKD